MPRALFEQVVHHAVLGRSYVCAVSRAPATAPPPTSLCCQSVYCIYGMSNNVACAPRKTLFCIAGSGVRVSPGSVLSLRTVALLSPCVECTVQSAQGLYRYEGSEIWVEFYATAIVQGQYMHRRYHPTAELMATREHFPLNQPSPRILVMEAELCLFTAYW